PLQGPPGTEFVLVCANRWRAPRRADVEKLLEAGRPWPALPPQALLFLNRDTVEVKVQRGVGNEPEANAVSRVQERVDHLRAQLSDQVEFFVGVAFSHQQ